MPVLENSTKGEEMSIDDTVFTLKEILLDAARYRWLRAMHITARVIDEDTGDCVERYIMGAGADLDDAVDEELSGYGNE